MSSGERAALLAPSSRVDGDGGTFATTATERDVDVEAAGSDGVGASSARSSAWRRRTYLWLTIASTATFAIIMAIVAYGVSPSTALAEGALPTSAGETRATLGERERDVEEDSYEDEAALGARERRTRRRNERREDAFARAYVERHARGSDDEPTREERLASGRAAEDAEDAVLDAREARRQKRVATRVAARVEAARDAAAEEAKETSAETSSLSRAAAPAGDAAAREARREQRRATREAARAVEERKEVSEAKEATTTRVEAKDTIHTKSTEDDDSDDVSPREVRRERRRAERIAKRMVENRLGDDDDDDNDRSSSTEKALKRQAKREQQEDAEKSAGRAAERQHKRDVENAADEKNEDRKRRDKRDDDDGDNKKDARAQRKDEASERQEKREQKAEAERRESEREQKRKDAEREKAEKDVEKRRDDREKEDDKSDDAAEKRQDDREEKREKLQDKREEIQRKAESKKREADERQEEREKDRKEDEKDRENDAEKRQDERQERREEIQRKAEAKKDAAEKREKESKETQRKAQERKEEHEKREKERDEKLEDKAEDEKKEIEEAKEERDEKLDKLKRKAEEKKRKIEELKKEQVKNRKNSRESADLGEATKDAIFLTYSDHVTGGMCASAETAAMNDIDLQMLGAQGPSDPFAFPDVKNVKTKKVFAFLHALTDEVWRNKFGIGDDTIVSVGDATDVLYFKHRLEMIRAFEEIEAESKVGDGKLVVVSGERNCWPWMIHGKERLPKGKEICASFPDAPSSYKYLNSGSLMGRAKGLAALLRDVVDRMQSVNEDDQLILANAFLRQSAPKTSPVDSPYVIKLDHMQRLFQTAYDGQLASPNFAQYRAKDAYYDRAHTQVVNTETNTTPVIVHFNGLKANLFPIARHFMVHHGHAEQYAQIKQSWLQAYPFFNATCQHIVDNIKIGIMPPMLKPTHTITDIERKHLAEER